MEDQIMGAGIAHAGAVVRRGELLLRPANRHSAAVHRYLRALHESGFDGASVPVGIEHGQEVLKFIPGEVALVPYPAWARSDEALASIATLMRRLHEAAACFDPSGEDWPSVLADPAGGPVVCHNDVCLENVVFRDGRAVALLDFDYAAPGRPLYDLAHFARMCVPLDDEQSAAMIGWRSPDRVAPLRLVADAYGVEVGQRGSWLTLLDQSIEQSGRFLAEMANRGEGAFPLMWQWIGGWERFDRRRDWWLAHRGEFERALR